LDKIIEELRRIDGDIICLQEVDVGCERSNSLDTGDEELLQYYFVFLLAFSVSHQIVAERKEAKDMHLTYMSPEPH
jgi:endonuclease/exonuclease/phosphatase family metal-dependent hydrolase